MRPHSFRWAQYCFMNAAVQCLRHTPKMADAIAQSAGDSTGPGVLSSFAELLQQLCVRSVLAVAADYCLTDLLV